ncbi:MAG: ABC transporter permease [Bacteroidetes bacterium HGW-Bacteroidetes-8]|nr:MAG: ABC transporter permease [Bacteroidetes bacterium HGW-Bacteroidetes-8]
MNTSKLSLIITREFLIRVKKRSFIIMTILTPIFIAALVVLPSVIMTISSGKKDQTILVVDRSELCEPFFKNSEEFNYKFDPTADVASLKKDFPGDLFAMVEISAPDSMMNVSVSAHSPKQLNMDAKNQIEGYVQKALEDTKLKKYNIENLDQILKDVRAEVSVKTFTITEEGDEKLGMVEIYMAISYLLSFFIYMFIFMFGSMVMRGVIEEKTNRIVEVIISSVKPFQLMLGKILGVGSVALLQFFIWIILTAGIIFGVQAIIGMDKITQGSEMAQQLSAVQASGELNEVMTALPKDGSPMGDIMSALSAVPVTSILISFLLYFLLGYLLYAAMFSAVGSAVDNEADTQQLILPVTLPLIIGLFIMVHTFQHPDSSLSFWGSMIPFTSPMVMMARVPFGVPLWELALSIGLLIVTFLLMTYLSAKIYRVGILMYGKKASWREIIKWIRY